MSLEEAQIFLLSYSQVDSVSARGRFIRRVDRQLATRQADATIYSLATIMCMKPGQAQDWLPILGVCLKHHPTLNAYIIAQSLGPVHYLVAVLSLMLQAQMTSEDLQLIYHLMVLVGSNPAAWAFEKSQTGAYSTLIVSDWARERGLRYESNFFDTHSALSRQCGIILNRPDLATGHQLSSLDRLEVIICQATHWIPYLGVLPHHLQEHIVDSAAVELWKAAENQQAMCVDYTMMNRVCWQISQSAEDDVTDDVDLLLAMIQIGGQLDTHQSRLISNVSDLVSRAVVEAYQQPFWRKWCRGHQSTIPSDLTGLALSTGLITSSHSITHKYICQSFESFSQEDPSHLVEHAIARQRARVEAESFNFQVPQSGIGCTNGAYMIPSPYEYSDLQLVTYIEPQRQAMWCFTQPEFADLLTTQMHPVSRVPLVRSVIRDLHSRQLTYEDLGVSSSHLYPISKALSKLQVADEITDDETQKSIQQVEQQLLQAHVPAEYLRSLAPSELAHLVQDSDSLLAKLHPRHAYATFCRLVVKQQLYHQVTAAIRHLRGVHPAAPASYETQLLYTQPAQT